MLYIVLILILIVVMGSFRESFYETFTYRRPDTFEFNTTHLHGPTPHINTAYEITQVPQLQGRLVDSSKNTIIGHEHLPHCKCGPANFGYSGFEKSVTDCKCFVKA